jgi:hypothetical protein
MKYGRTFDDSFIQRKVTGNNHVLQARNKIVDGAILAPSSHLLPTTRLERALGP